MKAVILAAGHGLRLVGNTVPHKALLLVRGRPVIDYTIDAFIRGGVTDIAIIVGHHGDALRDAVGDGSRYGVQIRYVFNPDHERGNALSVSVARTFVENSPFLLAMADHMVSTEIVQSLLDAEYEGGVLGVDFAPSLRHIEEGTRVRVDDQGFVSSIGKGLPEWDGIDSGVFRFTRDIFNAIDDLITQGDERNELSQAITQMIGSGHPLRAQDISGCFWHDVDTWDDLTFAREAVAAMQL